METLTNNDMSTELVKISRQKHLHLNDQIRSIKLWVLHNSIHRIERKNAAGNTTTLRTPASRLGEPLNLLILPLFCPHLLRAPSAGAPAGPTSSERPVDSISRLRLLVTRRCDGFGTACFAGAFSPTLPVTRAAWAGNAERDRERAISDSRRSVGRKLL